MPKHAPLPEESKIVEGYPQYPAADDIYARSVNLVDANPENPNEKKQPNDTKKNVANEKDFTDDMTGGDLDVPGTEDDNSMSRVGIEDEENNLYSLGGDEHENLDEDKG